MSKKPKQLPVNEEGWGNIELPGLSDDELYAKDWNRTAANQEKARDPVWRKKRYDALLKKTSTETWKQNHRLGVDKRTAENNDWKANVGTANREKAKSDNWIAKCQLAMEKNKANAKWIEMKKQSGKTLGLNNSRKVKTPDGVFDSVRQAREFYKIPDQGIQFLMKTFPKKFYYLDQGPGEIVAIPRKMVKTPDGIFDNVAAAARYYDVHATTISHSWMKLYPKKYKFIIPTYKDVLNRMQTTNNKKKKNIK